MNDATGHSADYARFSGAGQGASGRMPLGAGLNDQTSGVATRGIAVTSRDRRRGRCRPGDLAQQFYFRPLGHTEVSPVLKRLPG
jgi:hypothetical protein